MRDGDKVALPNENIFKLPGTQPPEKDLFESQAVKDYIQSTYNVNLENFVAGMIDIDHHDWFERLAYFISQDEFALISEAARAYVQDLPELEVASLINLLKEATRK